MKAARSSAATVQTTHEPRERRRRALRELVERQRLRARGTRDAARTQAYNQPGARERDREELAGGSASLRSKAPPRCLAAARYATPALPRHSAQLCPPRRTGTDAGCPARSSSDTNFVVLRQEAVVVTGVEPEERSGRAECRRCGGQRVQRRVRSSSARRWPKIEPRSSARSYPDQLSTRPNSPGWWMAMLIAP